ncbi:hypothetical protein SDC9_150869 [bioreactor metagenome]|uniref:Uncharacterized protein n=1 Tax=bioreactor metagenome TaxID=1076179 RepID=A0A645ENP4_9ZZZZ
MDTYYDKCPYCHANLDPGEPCNCKGEAFVPPKRLTVDDIKPGDEVIYIGGTAAAKRHPEKYPGIGTKGTVTLVADVGKYGKAVYVRWKRNGRPALLDPVQAPMLARA